MSQDEKRRIVFPEPEGKRLALVIGVDQALGADDPLLHNKLNAIKDAEDIAHVLEAPHCGFTLLRSPFLGEAATSANVKNAILELARHREPDDFLLLYFAGHGYPMRGRGNIADIYLVTHDFHELVAKEDENFHLSMRWIRDKLYLAKDEDTDKAAGKVLLIFDCCKAGNFGRSGEDPYLEELQARINEYFGAPSARSGFPPGRLRQALASTGHGQDAGEQDGHGRMTGYLLNVLRGEVEATIDLQDYGKVNLWLVRNYLQRVMPEAQKPTLSGDDAGKLCVLAQHEERAEAIRQRERLIVHERPNTYLPFRLANSIQPRPKILRAVVQLLTEKPESGEDVSRGPVVGLLGIGGSGKSHLAREVAYDCKNANRFPGGIFWLTIAQAGREALQAELARLCEYTEYRPADDNVRDPGNEGRRARHLCRYLAQHPDALLILDNVGDIDRLVAKDLPFFAGEELRCSILYTSRDRVPTLSSVKPYYVPVLSEKSACLLLMAHRPEELQQIQVDPQGQLAQDARAIYEYVMRLPLALTLLRDLLRDAQLTLAHLREELVRRGTLDVTRAGEEIIKARLFQTFERSWKRVHSAKARRLFQLAASFPEAIPIPLWLLGLTADLSGLTVLEPLGLAREELYRLSLIERSPDGETLRMHPLIREFGQALNSADPLYGRLQAEAQVRLTNEFVNINTLERRAHAKGYWDCLTDVQQALNYASSLMKDEKQVRHLERIAYWMAHDGDLLVNQHIWPKELPALFHQQLYNGAVEDGYILSGSMDDPWIRQQSPVGTWDPKLLGRWWHPDEVLSVDFAPEGDCLLTACADGSVQIRSTYSGRILRSIGEHSAEVMRAVFSPNGAVIATCSRDGTALLWNRATGEQLHRLAKHTAGIQSITFSSDGTRVATASEDCTAMVWDVASGEMVAYLARHRTPVSDVAFSPDGSSLVTCALEGNVYLWDIESEQVSETLLEDNDGLKSLAFSPDGSSILISCIEGVLLWDVQQKRIVRTFATHYAEKGYFITQVVFSPDGKYIAVSSSSKMMQIYELVSGKVRHIFRHNDMVSSSAFSPDGLKVVTASLDHTVSIWNIPSDPTVEDTQAQVSFVGSSAFSGDGAWLVATTDKRRLQLWDVLRDQRLVDESLPIDDPLPINELYKITGSVAISGDGTLVAVGFLNTVLFWNRKLNSIQPLGVDEASIRRQLALVSGIALSPDGRFIASGTIGETVRVWDVWAQCVVGQLRGHRGNITTVAYTPDGRSIVTGSTDGTACIWETERYTRRSILPDHLGEVTALCISPDGNLIATGDLDGTVHLWSLVRGESLGTVKRNLQRITSLAFSPDSRFLVSCDLLGQVLFWSLRREAGVPKSSLAGWYVAPQEIGAVHWGEPRHVTLADTGGLDGRPHFYRLALEGDWGFESAQP